MPWPCHPWPGSTTLPQVTKPKSARIISLLPSGTCMHAALMHKYGAHGATDVTGFGILGHVHNLAEAQKASVDLVLDTMPGE